MNEPRYARCPRCRCAEIALHETHAEHGATDFGRHEIDGGSVIPAAPFFFEPGDPISLHGECSACGHEWRMRKVVGS